MARAVIHGGIVYLAGQVDFKLEISVIAAHSTSGA
jgi:hypothetical protein